MYGLLLELSLSNFTLITCHLGLESRQMTSGGPEPSDAWVIASPSVTFCWHLIERCSPTAGGHPAVGRLQGVRPEVEQI